MTQTNIQWRQLGGIVAVQGSITLAWVIYSLYFPDLLVQLGFSRGLAAILFTIENILAAAIEPIFGGLSDRAQQEMGTRFPWIALGVVLASALFLAFPVLALLGSPASTWRWVVVLLALLWASAMAIFRSPVVVLLGQAAPQPKFPLVASCLTLVQQFIGAFRFVAYNFILAFGPLFAFATGSFVLLGAALFLRRVTPTLPPQPQPKRLPVISGLTLDAILGTAVSFGWGLRFLFSGLAQVLAVQLGDDRVSLGLFGFSLLLALTALPAGQLASRIGNGRAMLAGLVTAAVLLGGVSSTPSPALVSAGAIVLGFALSTALNGAVPFVLELVPEQRSGLGIGIYFGAFGGAIAFFDLVFARFSSLGVQASLGAIALLLASLCVAIGQQHSSGRDRQAPVT